MYRTLLSVLLYTIAVAAAPQDTVNSAITYVKIKPVADDVAPPTTVFRESRIENLPLTIPGTVSSRIEEKNTTKRENNFVRPFVIDDKVLIKDDTQASKDDTQTSNNDTQAANDDKDNSRKIRSEYSTLGYEADTIEPTEANTESVEELIQQTEEYEARTKAPSPRFLSKLSYFKKEDVIRSSIATNLVERVGKRKFKSKCKCEKIWNCNLGKLQITVPRCPNEYFLCC